MKILNVFRQKMDSASGMHEEMREEIPWPRGSDWQLVENVRDHVLACGFYEQAHSSPIQARLIKHSNARAALLLPLARAIAGPDTTRCVGRRSAMPAFSPSESCAAQ
jgi:hypothetical protein